MELQNISSGGMQYIPQIPDEQIIYIDFDGALTGYKGDALNIDKLHVPDSGLNEDQISDIAAQLNSRFAGKNVIFVTEKPRYGIYSTIYVGKTSQLMQLGDFKGLAEKSDTGNQVKDDNAFVMLDSNDPVAEIVDVIAHEAGHLLGTVSHGDPGSINSYAMELNLTEHIATLTKLYSEYYAISQNLVNLQAAAYYEKLAYQNNHVEGYRTVTNWLVPADTHQTVGGLATASMCKILGSQTLNGKAVDCYVLGGTQLVQGSAYNTYVKGYDGEEAFQVLAGTGSAYNTVLASGGWQIVDDTYNDLTRLAANTVVLNDGGIFVKCTPKVGHNF